MSKPEDSASHSTKIYNPHKGQALTPSEIRELFLIDIETTDIRLTEKLEKIRFKNLKTALISPEKAWEILIITKMKIAWEISFHSMRKLDFVCPVIKSLAGV